ncbi:MAG: acyltransferase, partial [Erysipelotrichaceae bacterium]|nr:acyltransferase [Erysipelotrichaceae bacterium]
MGEKRNQYLDKFRAILCLAVLLYHLDLLKGGYLAVCCFFALSGYLSTRSLLKKEKVDLKKHYLSRLKKIYLPLLVVVLTSIAIISLQQGIVWVSLKPETTSVLLGYNNFWQINANLDYFARHTSSPFIHLWY